VQHSAMGQGDKEIKHSEIDFEEQQTESTISANIICTQHHQSKNAKSNKNTRKHQTAEKNSQSEETAFNSKRT